MQNGNGDHFVVLQLPEKDVETGVQVPRSPTTGPEFLLRLVEEGDSRRFEGEMSNLPRLDVRAPAGMYYDRTPLHLAAMLGNVEIVRCILRILSEQDLVYAQEVVNALDRFGYTPLHLAVRGTRPTLDGEAEFAQDQGQHREEVVRLLTRSSWLLPDRFTGATSDRDEFDLETEGFTPLHMAAWTGNIPIVKLLLRQSLCRGEYSSCDPVNIHATTWKGNSPLDIAKDYDHVELVDLLECNDITWLQSERDKNANSINAVLVGAALIAAATFTTWLQPPLGVPDPVRGTAAASDLKSQGRYSTAFFLCVALAFALSLVALFIGTFALIPFTGTSLRSEVHYLRMVVRRAAYFIFAAILFLNLAFLCSSLLVLDKVAIDKSFSKAGNFIICFVFMVWTLYLARFLRQFRHRKKGIPGEKTYRNLILGLGVPLLIGDAIIVGIVFHDL